MELDDKREWNPLLSATDLGQEDVVRDLLSQGTHVRLCGYDGITALHVATLNGHFYIAQILLDAGANPNAPLRNGDTPFHLAKRAESHSVLLQELLLLYGADHTEHDPVYRNLCEKITAIAHRVQDPRIVFTIMHSIYGDVPYYLIQECVDRKIR